MTGQRRRNSLTATQFDQEVDQFESIVKGSDLSKRLKMIVARGSREWVLTCGPWLDLPLKRDSSLTLVCEMVMHFLLIYRGLGMPSLEGILSDIQSYRDDVTA